MAASKKKVVTKDDLRRLMREKKASGKTSTQKVTHPYAKYNGLDQLVCVLCNTVIKGELLWPSHIQSRGHREKLSALKDKQSTAVGVKRKADEDSDLSILKKLKDKNDSKNSGLPTDFFDNNASSKTTKSAPSGKPKSILAHYSSSEEEEEEDTPTAANNMTSTAASGLPTDFFDNGIAPPAGTSAATEPEAKPAMSDLLPEGFFDNPKMDAKVRKVEYVDKMEEEWEMFQKAMKEETHVSEAIIEEDDEQANVDREIDEIDEQIQCWKEVNDLETKKEEIMKKEPQNVKKDDDSDEDLDEAKLDEFLDWRSKKSWR